MEIDDHQFADVGNFDNFKIRLLILPGDAFYIGEDDSFLQPEKGG